MNTKRYAMAIALALSFSAPFLLLAQQAPAGAGQGRGQGQGRGRGPQPMSFFVTSTSLGKGGDLGGLDGADAHCNALAKAAGSAKTFHAYLSTQGPNAVNARDRIGNGPWYNAKGQQIAASVADLHGDTIEQARLGNRINKISAVSEKGEPLNGIGDSPNQHDILTGSQPDGRAFPAGDDMTCGNYTSSADGQGSVMLGHHDRLGGPNASWNAVHKSNGCSQQNLISTGGNGYLYCFAVD
jgi:hypothetical protein